MAKLDIALLFADTRFNGIHIHRRLPYLSIDSLETGNRY
jgi:hypothetical protein